MTEAAAAAITFSFIKSSTMFLTSAVSFYFDSVAMISSSSHPGGGTGQVVDVTAATYVRSPPHWTRVWGPQGGVTR